MDRFEKDLPPSSSDADQPASSPMTRNANSGASRPIQSVSQFTAGMLEAARELYQDEAIRRETATRLS